MHHKVLIVGTVPYNKGTTARAFDAYFHNWERENLRQIFSNTKTPVKGHCGSLYQITDQRLLKKLFRKIDEVGVVYEYSDLPDSWKDNDLEVGSRFINALYKLGSKESAIKHVGRKWLWKKKFWNTRKLNAWLDDFQPECVFLAFSDDFFIPEIALYVAEKFNIPIVSCIGDDYYFNDRFSLSPIYRFYRREYKALIRRVFQHRGSAIYISDKIRDKYNEAFHLNGETVYLTSDIVRHSFRPVNQVSPRITYCGNIRLGRNKSLADIGRALFELDPNYRLEVYSAEKNEEYIGILREKQGIDYRGAVPYSEVMKVMRDSDIVVIVEGFEEKNVTITRYSLSTKAADAMASGGQVLVYGPVGSGVIDYMLPLDCAAVCTARDTEKLKSCISSLISDTSLQRQLYDHAGCISAEHHDKKRNLDISEKIINDLVESE